jgi:phospholipid/cholesterol/gamma-HCH transport system substrate-binding protein
MQTGSKAKIGFVTVLAILILAGMIAWKGDIFLKTSGYRLVGVFKNVGGLQENSDVRYRGYKVGKVLKIVPGIVDTRTYMNISGGIQVPEGSTLRIAFDGLIGQKFVEILPAYSVKTLKPGSEIPGVSTLGLVDFIDAGTLSLEELKSILESVKKMTGDPQTQVAVKNALINIEAATSQLNRLVSDINSIMNKKELEKTLTTLGKTSDMVVNIVSRLDKITAAVEDLASDPEFSGDIKGAAKEAKDAMEELKNAASDIRKTLRKLVR